MPLTLTNRNKRLWTQQKSMAQTLTSLLCPKKPFSSVQFSRSVVSDSVRPHELQQSRPPCPSPTPGFKCTYKDLQLSCGISTITQFVFYSPYMQMYFILPNSGNCTKLTLLFLFHFTFYLHSLPLAYFRLY